MDAFQELYDRHALRGFEKQSAIHRQIGDWRWDLDLEGQALVFSKRKLFSKNERTSRMQVLGVHQAERNGFEWATEGEWLVGSLTAPILQRAKALRELGVNRGFEAFGFDAFESSEQVNGNTIAIIAVGEFNLPGFFAPTVDTATPFFLLEDASLRDDESPLAVRIAGTCRDVLGTGGFQIADFKLALKSYLEGHGLTVDSDGAAALVGRGPAGLRVRASFDGQGRIAEIVAET